MRSPPQKKHPKFDGVPISARRPHVRSNWALVFLWFPFKQTQEGYPPSIVEVDRGLPQEQKTAFQHPVSFHDCWRAGKKKNMRQAPRREPARATCGKKKIPPLAIFVRPTSGPLGSEAHEFCLAFGVPNTCLTLGLGKKNWRLAAKCLDVHH